MKKILFWINSGTMNIFGLSKILEEDLTYQKFGIFDVTEKQKKFFENQKLVNFEKTYFYHDYMQKKENIDYDYLKKFEDKYKINLWKLASTERIFLYNEFYNFSTEEIAQILENECRFFEKTLDEISPDFVIMVRPYFHHDTIFFQLCKAKNIKILELDTTRFPGKSVISFSETKKKYKEFEVSNKIRNFDELKKFRKTNAASRDTDFTSTKKNFLSAGIEYFLTTSETKNRNYKYFGRSKLKVFFNYIFNIFRDKNREKFLEKNFLKDYTEDRKFILFTLSVDAESALLLDAPYYINQIEVVKNIAKSLPSNLVLLVKEHPAAGLRSWRSIEIYKELISIPNVVAIHHSANTEKLIKKSSLVISICSSSSLDALFFEKPTMIFADTDFSMIEDIHRLKEIEKLPECINECLRKKVDSKNIEKYIQFIEKNSFDYNFILHGQLMQKYLYHGSLLVDVEFSEEQMNLFLNETREEFTKLKNEYVEKINASI